MNHKHVDDYDPNEDDNEQLTLFSYSDRVHREFSRFDSKTDRFREIERPPIRITSESTKEKTTATYQVKEPGLVFWK